MDQIDQALLQAEQLLSEVTRGPVSAPSPQEIQALVQSEVQKAVGASLARIPVLSGPPGKDGSDGTSVTLEDVQPVIESLVSKIPVPKDGRDGKDGAPGKKVVREKIISMPDYERLLRPDGSAQVTFTPSGSGATSSSVQTELRALGLRPEQFGAVGDGSTDDTAAFTACLVAAAAQKKKIWLKSAQYKANITITGEAVHMEADVWAYRGDNSGVGIVPATLTSPTIQIGDGTTLTRDITINGVSLEGSNTGDKGLLINGANDVYLNGFSARQFEEYVVRLTSSASRSTFFVFFNGFHIQNGTTTGSLGVDQEYGASFTTAIYWHNGAFNANTGASFLYQLDGSGTNASMSNVWIEAGDDQGINFATTGTKIDCANVIIDSSSATHSLVTMPANDVLANYLRGTVTIDGVVTMPGGDTAAISNRMHFPDRSFYNSPNIIGQINFQNASGAVGAWQRYATGLSAQNIARSGTILRLSSTDGTIELITGNTGFTLSNGGVANVSAATATPAAGSSSAVLLLGTTAGFGIYYGSGAPTVSAAQGSLYLRSDGSSTSTRAYINSSSGSGTTWTAITTAA